MRIKMLAVCVLVFAFAGGLTAAENPFAGTWKLNPAKSKLTGDTMKFEKTASGTIRISFSGLSYTFNVDGKEYTGPFGEAVAWKQVDDSTWETTNKQKGILLSTDTTKLSSDGKTMTVVSKGTKPNGEAFQNTIVYERISGDKGLLDSWRDKEVKAISPVTYRNPQSQEDEPGAEVFLEGTSEPLGWISREHLPLVTSELTGVLVSGGPYTLKVLCPLPEQGAHS